MCVQDEIHVVRCQYCAEEVLIHFCPSNLRNIHSVFNKPGREYLPAADMMPLYDNGMFKTVAWIYCNDCKAPTMVAEIKLDSRALGPRIRWQFEVLDAQKLLASRVRGAVETKSPPAPSLLSILDSYT